MTVSGKYPKVIDANHKVVDGSSGGEIIAANYNSIFYGTFDGLGQLFKSRYSKFENGYFW